MLIQSEIRYMDQVEYPDLDGVVFTNSLLDKICPLRANLAQNVKFVCLS